jgi:3-phosphoshikimate 1-carboxyvinyltransferase
MPVASAQVKSAILLAALYPGGKTQVIEPVKTRDHTERMLKLFHADIKHKGNKIVIRGGRPLVSPRRIYLPGDISSAAFFMAAAAILPHSRLAIRNTGLNLSRMGVVRVLKRMGADIKIKNLRHKDWRIRQEVWRKSSKSKNFEPMGDILVKSSKLKGVIVKRAEIPSLIDELPVLMVAACFARGRTVLEGVQELRVKETDRIRSLCANLKKMGADIRSIKSKTGEKILIRGPVQLKGASVRSFGDHRTAMSVAVAALAAKGKTCLDDISCIRKSFPGFVPTLKTLIR